MATRRTATKTITSGSGTPYTTSLDANDRRPVTKILGLHHAAVKAESLQVIRDRSLHRGYGNFGLAAPGFVTFGLSRLPLLWHPSKRIQTEGQFDVVAAGRCHGGTIIHCHAYSLRTRRAPGVQVARPSNAAGKDGNGGSVNAGTRHNGASPHGAQHNRIPPSGACHDTARPKRVPAHHRRLLCTRPSDRRR